MRMGTSYQEIRQGLHGMTQSRDKGLENGKQSLSPCIKILTTINWVLLGHSYNPSNGEAKAGGSKFKVIVSYPPNVRSTWDTGDHASRTNCTEDVHGEAVSRALQFAHIQDGLTFLSSLPHKITN